MQSVKTIQLTNNRVHRNKDILIRTELQLYKELFPCTSYQVYTYFIYYVLLIGNP